MQIEMMVAVAGGSTAAIRICSRLGVGRIRHPDARRLWLREKVASEEVRTNNVPTNENVADLTTKALDLTRCRGLARRLSVTLQPAR
eukprot:1690315-Pyramimonas_sp.AAC.1